MKQAAIQAAFFNYTGSTSGGIACENQPYSR